MDLFIYFQRAASCTAWLHMENVALTYKSMSGWVCVWPFANSWGMGHAKSDSHRFLHWRRAKLNLPFGLHATFFFFFREMCYICPGHKSCLWGEQPKGFCHSVHETQRFQSVILKLSVLGYAIRWSGTGNQLDIPVEALQLGDHTFQGHMFIWQVESRWGDSTNLQGKDKNRRIWKALVFSHRD